MMSQSSNFISVFIFGVVVSYIVHEVHSCATKTGWIDLSSSSSNSKENLDQPPLSVKEWIDSEIFNSNFKDNSNEIQDDKEGGSFSRQIRDTGEPVINVEDEGDDDVLDRFGRRIFNASESGNKTLREMNAGYFQLKLAFEHRTTTPKSNNTSQPLQSAGNPAGNTADPGAAAADSPAAKVEPVVETKQEEAKVEDVKPDADAGGAPAGDPAASPADDPPPAR